jgi:hypothetical protein
MRVFHCSYLVERFGWYERREVVVISMSPESAIEQCLRKFGGNSERWSVSEISLSCPSATEVYGCQNF